MKWNANNRDCAEIYLKRERTKNERSEMEKRRNSHNRDYAEIYSKRESELKHKKEMNKEGSVMKK